MRWQAGHFTPVVGPKAPKPTATTRPPLPGAARRLRINGVRDDRKRRLAGTRCRRDLSIDQQLARSDAAARLQAEFAEHFDAETIKRFLHTSYDQVAARECITRVFPPSTIYGHF
jgi:hypothetical protein